MKLLRAIQHLCLLGIGILLVAPGCETAKPPDQDARAESTWRPENLKGRLRNGDQVNIKFDTGGGNVKPPDPLETRIDENGEINLTLIGNVKAEGLTPSELARQIESLYVPRYFVRCSVTVLATERYFYVSGEVGGNGQFEWKEDMTLLKAISVAGNFTDYANRGSVQITRGGRKFVVNAEEARKNPSKDIFILPGDSIWVPRSVL